MQVQDIVLRAFRKIGVEAEDVELTEERRTRGRDAFNMMIHAWKLQGVDVGHTDLFSNSPFPFAPEFQEGCVYLLAQRLSPDYQVPANFDADDWFRKIQAAYLVIPEQTVPSAMIYMPNRVWRDFGTT